MTPFDNYVDSLSDWSPHAKTGAISTGIGSDEATVLRPQFLRVHSLYFSVVFTTRPEPESFPMSGAFCQVSADCRLIDPLPVTTRIAVENRRGVEKLDLSEMVRKTLR